MSEKLFELSLANYNSGRGRGLSSLLNFYLTYQVLSSESRCVFMFIIDECSSK